MLAQSLLQYPRQIDNTWDYQGEKTKSYTHGLHAYPAMFIPQVARRLIETYSQKGDVMCDIFCGSGTSLIEARLLGRNAFGVDLNPFAIFLAKAKTTELDPKILTREYIDLLKRINSNKLSKNDYPHFNNLEFWFKEYVIVELAKIKKAIKEIKDKKIRDFFLVSFSHTVRSTSNTRNGEFKLFKIQKEKLEKHNPDVLGTFKEKTEANIRAMTDFYNSVDKTTWAKPIYGDSSMDNGIADETIDLIITSPPYGDSGTTVAYGQFSRLSAQWIDIYEEPDIASALDGKLLGGKPTKTLVHDLNSNHLKVALEQIAKQDERRAREVLSFYVDLEKCLRKAYEILKKDKYFCLVIGNRQVKQVRIPTDYIIAEMGANIGFSCKDIIVRNIPSKRMPSRNSPTNVAGVLEETMNKESILILQKD